VNQVKQIIIRLNAKEATYLRLMLERLLNDAPDGSDIYDALVVTVAQLPEDLKRDNDPGGFALGRLKEVWPMLFSAENWQKGFDRKNRGK
jgi:hypothetical protein